MKFKIRRVTGAKPFMVLVAMVCASSLTVAQDWMSTECGDAGCGTEGCVGSDSDQSNRIDVEAIFNGLAGDDSVFGSLKNLEAGGITYSVGGELRHRFMNEANRLRPPGGNAEYSLWRFTPHLKVQFSDRVGAFVEGIDASAFQEGDDPYSPLPIDVNRLDFLRYYAEFTLFSDETSSLKYRYGRQFLKYGSQRLLSPLGWSNTFRNFEGHKLMYKSGDWAVDGFLMSSVNGAAGGSGFGITSLDSADNNRQISGVYSTYSGLENSKLDLYWLYFDEGNAAANRQDGHRHTLGARLGGSKPVKECDKVIGTWSWDFEGAYQFGGDNFASTNSDVSAGMLSANVGYTFNNLKWTPSIKGFYYWGSGSDQTGGNDNNTFFTLYPLGHAYWGLIDNFSGQNLQDVGATFSVKPHKKLSLSASYHFFTKANDNDFTYNIAGAPLGTIGGNGEIGQELDLLATIPVTKNFNIQTGYFWFFYGDEFAARDDARQFYVQTTLKF
ncbi:MAG: alginate export family protein [Fuerstiella sp.]